MMCVMAVLSRQPAQRLARRSEIERRVLEGTRRLLEQGGSFPEIPVEEFATAGGISRTAFYDYFPDKRALLLRLIETTAEPLLERVDELAGGRPSGPDGVRESLAAGLALARAHSPVVLAAVQAAAYDDVVDGRWRELSERFVEAITGRIERQQQAGMALPGPSRAVALVLVSLVTDCWRRQLSTGTELSDDELLDAIHLVWRRAVYGPEPVRDETQDLR